MERAKGNAPSYAAWKAAVLLLNYARKNLWGTLSTVLLPIPGVISPAGAICGSSYRLLLPGWWALFLRGITEETRPTEEICPSALPYSRDWMEDCKIFPCFPAPKGLALPPYGVLMDLLGVWPAGRGISLERFYQGPPQASCGQVSPIQFSRNSLTHKKDLIKNPVSCQVEIFGDIQGS